MLGHAPMVILYVFNVLIITETNIYRNVRGLGEAVKLLFSERRYTDFPLRKSL